MKQHANTKAMAIKMLITDLCEGITPVIVVIDTVEHEIQAVDRKTVLEAAKERHNFTEMQVDNYLSYLREDRLEKNKTMDPNTWWFSYNRTNRCYYHVPFIGILAGSGIFPDQMVIPVLPPKKTGIQIPDEELAKMTKAECLRFLGTHTDIVVDLGKNYNTKSTIAELQALTRKVMSKVKI